MIVVTVPGKAPQATLTRIVRTAEQHPGGHRLQVVAEKGPEPKRLTLGPRWSVSADAKCLQALGEYGQVDEC